MIKEEKVIYLGIVGSRRRNDYSDFSKVYDAYGGFRTRNDEYNIVIVSGGANRGGDDFAVRIAKKHGHQMIIYFPKIPEELLNSNERLDSKRWRPYYFARNDLVAKRCDALIASPMSLDMGLGGTGYTIARFKKLHPHGELIVV